MSYFDNLRSGLEVSPPPPPPCCSSGTEYVEQRGRMHCRGIGLPRFMLAYATFLLTMFNLYGLELPSQQPARHTVSAGRAVDDPDLCGKKFLWKIYPAPGFSPDTQQYLARRKLSMP